jgi:hypothetical protein
MSSPGNPPGPPRLPTKAEWDKAKAAARDHVDSQKTIVMGCKHPKIAINWRDHDFGQARKADGFPTRDLIITSTGTADLVLNQLQISDPHFKIANPGGYQTTLPPGNSTAVTIQFVPAETGKKSGRLTISSNGINERIIEVLLAGALATWVAIKMVDMEDRPVSGLRYRIHLPDGSTQEGTLGADGVAKYEDIEGGTCDVSFPDLDAKAWEPA